MKSFPMPLTSAEEKELISLLAQKDAGAREKLIMHNLRLVAHVIKKYNFPDIDQEEYISIGIVGLIKAIDSYNENKGIKLVTYASRCIDNEILMVLRSGKKLSREVYLNDPIGQDKEGNEINLLDILVSTEGVPGKDLILSEEIHSLREAFNTVLDEREKRILFLRYGFMNDVIYTQRQIADMYGISRSYVSRIEKRALDKLKNYLEA